MAPLLAVTQGAKLTQIRGVATVAAAGSLPSWGIPAAGAMVQGVAGGRAGPGPQPIRRHRPKLWHQPGGSAWGRRAILDLAAGVCRQPGRFHDSYQARLRHRKHPKVALTAVGNQVGRTCFALMASGSDYDPDHQTNDAERRTVKQRKAGGRAA